MFILLGSSTGVELVGACVHLFSCVDPVAPALCWLGAMCANSVLVILCARFGAGVGACWCRLDLGVLI